MYIYIWVVCELKPCSCMLVRFLYRDPLFSLYKFTFVSNAVTVGVSV